MSVTQVIENCVAAAGFSVGEYAALVFAGSMDFAEGTRMGLAVHRLIGVQGVWPEGRVGDWDRAGAAWGEGLTLESRI